MGKATSRVTIVALLLASLSTTTSTPTAAAPEHAPPPKHRRLELDVLSSAPHQVSGGDALVRVTAADADDLDDVRVELDGVDVTDVFASGDEPDTLVGLVTGLDEGRNRLTARVERRRGHRPRPAHLVLDNHPIGGPIFSGEQQQPFVCTTARATFDGRKLLGQPTVDNHDHFGIPVAAEGPDGDYPQDDRGYPTDEAEIVGWSKDCASPTSVGYVYRNTAGELHWLDDPGSPPADVATTTTLDGKTVPFVVRWERGTINRFIYSIAALAPVGESAPAEPATAEPDPDEQPDGQFWNRRLVLSFQGGVAIGHTQGTTSTGAMLPADLLGAGYGVVWSSGTRTSTHYDLQVGGETALMVKERFIERYDLMPQGEQRMLALDLNAELHSNGVCLVDGIAGTEAVIATPEDGFTMYGGVVDGEIVNLKPTPIYVEPFNVDRALRDLRVATLAPEIGAWFNGLGATSTDDGHQWAAIVHEALLYVRRYDDRCGRTREMTRHRRLDAHWLSASEQERCLVNLNFNRLHQIVSARDPYRLRDLKAQIEWLTNGWEMAIDWETEGFKHKLRSTLARLRSSLPFR